MRIVTIYRPDGTIVRQVQEAVGPSCYQATEPYRHNLPWDIQPTDEACQRQQETQKQRTQQ